MDFGTKRVHMAAAVGPDLGCPCSYDENIEQKMQTVKLGLNYRFWGGAPRMGY